MKKMVTLMIAGALVILTGAEGGGCHTVGADEKQERETAQMVSEAHQKIGMPNILNFTERRFAKYLLELRDEELATYSYFMDMHGNLHFLCRSVGYGIPYSVQFTNPERRVGLSEVTLPQPDPNGLFMPDGLSATFVLCSGEKGEIHPIYSEPSLIVSPIRLHAKSTYQEKE